MTGPMRPADAAQIVQQTANAETTTLEQAQIRALAVTAVDLAAKVATMVRELEMLMPPT